MPRAGRKGRQAKKAGYNTYCDVTLNDYANANAKAGGGTTLRVKKGHANALERESRLLSSPMPPNSKNDEDLNWFERDFDSDEEEPDKERDVVNVPTRRRRRKMTSLTVVDDGKGIVYPYDLWYQLCFYIHPSDVGRFAAICQTACAMVYSSAFWRHMYFTHYDKSIKLPEELQPPSIERIRGLRARSIRSVFYLYRPMADKTTPLVPFENEPHELRGQICLLSWHQPVKNNMWNFCFKFRRGTLPPRRILPSKLPTKGDILSGYDDLFFNPEEGCRILQVTVQNFVAIPMVMTMVLSQVFLTISSQMRHYRLRLLFNSSLQGGNSNSAEMIVDLDPVVNIRVLPWWAPKYPFTM